ncbi:lysoplasmalogenase [Rhodococcus phenolicus]|uniref:lysoplasmalogenase n=1 Tax=Rhodococcus phenolicus TaxID=263849 RepID=UPI00082DA957|nr:lysoplasmalogenase [Rhodococcus phenolicus]
MTGRPTAIVASAAFAVVAVAHLIAQAAAPESSFTDISQWLLMPLLAAALAASTRPPRTRLVRLVLVALGLSWLGDTAPDLFDGDASFLVMVGFFLCAQVVYLVAFVPYRSSSILCTRRWALAIPVAAVVALIAVCAPGAGTLLVPVVVYGVLLATTAVSATGVSAVVATGAVLFVVSDALIALGAFTDLAVPGFAVMSTYIAAQVLIAVGARAVAEPGDRPSDPDQFLRDGHRRGPVESR